MILMIIPEIVRMKNGKDTSFSMSSFRQEMMKTMRLEIVSDSSVKKKKGKSSEMILRKI